MALCQKEDANISEFADLIAKDMAMTANVLSVANSSAYRRHNKQINLVQSMQIIGMDMIKVLCISNAVYQAFDDFKHVNDSVLQVFWKHSQLTAIAARSIATKLDYPNIEEAYLAGLLHDVGRLTLLSLDSQEYTVDLFAQDDSNLCMLEQRMFEFTHAEAGAWLIEHWNFDSFLSDSILYHHEKTMRLENTHPLIRIVSLAELLSHHIQNNTSIAYEIIRPLCGTISINQDEINRDIEKQFKETLGKLCINNDLDLNQKDETPLPPRVTSKASASASASSQHTVKNQLNDNLRNYILISEVGKSFAKQQNKIGLLEIATNVACVLFNFKDAIIFMADNEGCYLKGMPSGKYRQHLADFTIPLNNAGNLIAEAVLKRKLIIITSKNKKLNVIEEQLIRILGTECLVCQPFFEKNGSSGILIGSVEPRQLVNIELRKDFLYEFAAQVTVALRALESKNNQVALQNAAISSEYHEKNRRIAHEVNNPISIIKNYLTVLNNKLAQKEPVNEEVAILIEEIDRVSALVNNLASPQPIANKGITAINGVVNHVAQLFLRSGYLPPSIDIVVQKSEQDIEVDCDVDILKQILLNLMKNAVEAMPEGGKITVGYSGPVYLEGRKYIKLWIHDNGPGIKDEIMEKLFSPVQSTKDKTHSGLGLNIVQNLVTQSQGHISCRNHKKGTTFEILLPVPRTPNNL